MAKIPQSQAVSERLQGNISHAVNPIAPIRGQVAQPVAEPDSGLRDLAQQLGTTADDLIRRNNERVAKDNNNFLIGEQLRIRKQLGDSTRTYLDSRGVDAFGSEAGLRKEVEQLKPSKELNPDMKVRWDNMVESAVQKTSDVRFSHEFAQRTEVENATVAGIIQNVVIEAEINDNGTLEAGNQSIEEGLAQILAVRGIIDEQGNVDIVEGIRLSLSNKYFNALLNKKLEAGDGTSAAVFFEQNKSDMADSLSSESFKHWQKLSNDLKDTVNFNAIDDGITAAIVDSLPASEDQGVITNFEKLSYMSQNLGGLVEKYGLTTVNSAMSLFTKSKSIDDSNQVVLDKKVKEDTINNVLAVLPDTPTTEDISTAIGILSKSALPSETKLKLINSINSNYGRGFNTDRDVYVRFNQQLEKGDLDPVAVILAIGNGLSRPDAQALTRMYTAQNKSTTADAKRFRTAVAGVVAFATENSLMTTDENGANRALDSADVRQVVDDFMQKNNIATVEDKKVIEYLRSLKDSKELQRSVFGAFFVAIGVLAETNKTGKLEDAVAKLDAKAKSDEEKIRAADPTLSDAEIQKLISNPDALAKTLAAIDAETQ